VLWLQIGESCETGQARPQAPQLPIFSPMQTPSQASWPAGQAHWPPVHDAPDAQRTSQSPQFCGSFWTSRQLVPQARRPSGHSQAPLTQVVPGPQASPQVPQFVLSVFLSTQVSLHTERPSAQPHWPPAQVAPVAQTFPQVPQFVLSVCGSTQSEPQRCGQTHAPDWQVEPVPVLCSHCAFGLGPSSMVPLQSLSLPSQSSAPLVHWQAPPAAPESSQTQPGTHSVEAEQGALQTWPPEPVSMQRPVEQSVAVAQA
jgi:hypothetical protein